MKRYPLIAFFVLAYLLTWCVVSLGLPALLSALAAMLYVVLGSAASLPLGHLSVRDLVLGVGEELGLIASGIAALVIGLLLHSRAPHAREELSGVHHAS